jgi:hypothetical protein
VRGIEGEREGREVLIITILGGTEERGIEIWIWARSA